MGVCWSPKPNLRHSSISPPTPRYVGTKHLETHMGLLGAVFARMSLDMKPACALSVVRWCFVWAQWDEHKDTPQGHKAGTAPSHGHQAEPGWPQHGKNSTDRKSSPSTRTRLTQLKKLKPSWWARWKLHCHAWSCSAADGWSWPYFGGIRPSEQVQPMLYPCFFFWSSALITPVSSTDHHAIGQIQPWVAPGLSELSPSAHVTFNTTAKTFFFS